MSAPTIFRWAACSLLVFASITSASADDGTDSDARSLPPAPPAPAVDQVEVRRVFDNGQHNAFTDLCRFRGRYYLAFRSCPDGHGVHPTSSIIVLESLDTQEWSEVFRFSVEKRDTRDPHFLVFQDRLFVYTGAWYCGDSSPEKYEMNKHLGFAVWSEDGRDWQGPRMLEGTYGHYIWRAAARDGKAYLCARRKHHFAETQTRAERDPLVEAALLESDDGFTWKTRGLMQEEYGDETAFLVRPSGKILGVARRGGNRSAELVEASPPYEQWTRTDLGQYIGGPLLVDWHGRYLVGGRNVQTGRAVTRLSWLEGDRLVPLIDFPSGGDNSYPGFLAFDESHALVSYYSSHERDARGKTITAIYLANLRLRPVTGDAPVEFQDGRRTVVADPAPSELLPVP